MLNKFPQDVAKRLSIRELHALSKAREREEAGRMLALINAIAQSAARAMGDKKAGKWLEKTTESLRKSL